ncbi:MAG TPA: hypothetical protein VNT01_01775 [Symbiobacteriaceae bacterium]|nr:hypothetical protein [Symbiobacteriaceae bacterium]
MRIINAKVAMASHQERSQTLTHTESLRAWVGSEPGQQRPRGDRLELSDEAKRLLQAPPPAESDPLKQDPLNALAPEDRIRVAILQALLGVEIKVNPKLPGRDDAQVAAAAEEAGAQAAGARREGWGVDYQLHERYAETESLQFAAQGVIHTADGQEIAFAVDLQMSRQFVQESNLRIRAGDAAKPIDPLVINYGGAAAELTERRFRFDLQAGGQLEEIPFLKEGSGFLALDKSGDGKINNGAELFGPTSGDGFSELAAYDADGNQWIDEADPIFDKLQIWTKDASGNDRLFALGQLGIGAIFVGAVDAGFTLTDTANRAQAINRKAGLYVSENGTAGTVQQLDIMA